ncbi:MAG: WecB/TagA/CpsF family glycosyltransferase [Candidatus Promineifilaceae bacterium]
MPNSVNILGVRIDDVTMDSVVDWIAAALKVSKLHQICTPNPEFVMKAQRDADFMRVLNSAECNIPDGAGLLWAAKRLGKPLSERVPGSELVHHIAKRAANEGWRLFLLGAAPGVAAECAEIWQAQYPTLQIVGTYSGSPAMEENETIVAMINASSADILLVAYGAPKQDKWIARNREQLTSVRVAAGIGGSFDFVVGKSTRAPRWVQNLNLEWLHRLILEPWRLPRMMTLPKFVWAVRRNFSKKRGESEKAPT